MFDEIMYFSELKVVVHLKKKILFYEPYINEWKKNGSTVFICMKNATNAEADFDSNPTEIGR